jgi:hypothetical protein
METVRRDKTHDGFKASLKGDYPQKPIPFLKNRNWCCSPSAGLLALHASARSSQLASAAELFANSKIAHTGRRISAH